MNWGIFMAKRLATAYVKAGLRLDESELKQFVSLFERRFIRTSMKQIENGHVEFILYDEQQQREISILFEKKQGLYVADECSFYLENSELDDLIRRAIIQFEGNAFMHRIYLSFTIIYKYVRGTVVKISEWSDGCEKKIYEYRNMDVMHELKRLYARNDVEMKIKETRMKIDDLLDLRNRVEGTLVKKEVDQRLAKQVQKLFVYEA